MKFKLENPPHQITAIHSVVEVFRGMEKNTYDNAHIEDIHSNVCSLSSQELMDNIMRVIAENNVPANQSCIIESNDACIEMETGGFQLTYNLEKQESFTQNTVYLATDGIKTAYICVDSQLYNETVNYFMEHTDTKFICIERALDTTKKFNLKKKMGDKFFAF